MSETGMMADIAAVTDNNRGYAYPVYPGGYGNSGFGFGGDWIGLIVLALLFGGGFGGFGGFGGGGMGLGGGLLGYALGNNATKTDLSDGLVALQTSNKIDNLSTQLCGGLSDVTAAITNGTYNVNTGLLTGFANSNLAAAQNTASVISAINNSEFAMDKCCCDIKTAIANSDNQAFRNTCDLKDAIREQGEATRALIVTNEITDLREKLAAERQRVQDARFDASQIAQTNQLIQTLQPVAKPSYIVSSPFQSLFPYNGYGYGGYGYNQFIS